jgi:alkylation response protein AidB-like acyl-CoA dehydrogenase
MSNKVFNGGEYLLTDVTCNDVFTPEGFSDEHRQIGETTEQFVVNEIWPNNDEIEAQNFDLVVAKLKVCAELGLMMIDTPEDYGGLELDKVTSMLVMEKMAYSKNFGLSYMVHTGIGMLPLIYYGTSEQKERYLEKLMTAEIVAAYGLTEPGSGSDALGAKTSAILSEDGSHYILNGTKQFISNSAFADLFTIFAKVDKEHFTAFLVERSFDGLEVGPEEKKMGMKGSSTCQVIMNNVKVPVANLLGEVGRGHKIAFNVLNVGRFKLGAWCLGQKKYALSEGARYANERKQFNVPIGSFGAVREKLADVTAMTFASEAVIYRLAGLIDDRQATIAKGGANYYAEYQKGIEEYAAECAIAKVYCTETAAKTIDEMLQIHGGYGFIAEYPVEQLYRDERCQRIYEGTNEINRLLIPGTFLRKGIGETYCPEEIDADSIFAAEKALLQGMKQIYFSLAGQAIKTLGVKAAEEQELLLALADVAIQAFALESTLLRSEKAYPQTTGTKQEQYVAVVRVVAFSTSVALSGAAQRCAAFIDAAGETDLLETIARLGRYEVKGLLAAKRLLADAASDAEQYIF